MQTNVDLAIYRLANVASSARYIYYGYYVHAIPLYYMYKRSVMNYTLSACYVVPVHSGRIQRVERERQWKPAFNLSVLNT